MIKLVHKKSEKKLKYDHLNAFIFRKKIRQLIKNRLQNITPEQKLQFSIQAAKRIMTWPPLIRSHHIALFLSVHDEIDTHLLINQLWNKDKKVYLPALHPFSTGDLLFLRYHTFSKMKINRLKISEPVLDIRNVLPLNEIDVLVTPLVAFDINGYRLGKGGGFYDRTLKNWKQHNIQPIGYAYDHQLVTFLPIKKWDVPLPAIVTPSRLLVW